MKTHKAQKISIYTQQIKYPFIGIFIFFLFSSTAFSQQSTELTAHINELQFSKSIVEQNDGNTLKSLYFDLHPMISLSEIGNSKYGSGTPIRLHVDMSIADAIYMKQPDYNDIEMLVITVSNNQNYNQLDMSKLDYMEKLKHIVFQFEFAIPVFDKNKYVKNYSASQVSILYYESIPE